MQLTTVIKTFDVFKYFHLGFASTAEILEHIEFKFQRMKGSFLHVQSPCERYWTLKLGANQTGASHLKTIIFFPSIYYEDLQ